MMHENGLSDNEVIKSRKKYGSNALTEVKKKTFFKLFLESLGDPIIKILLIALAIKVVFLFKDFDWFETLGILIAVFLASFISTISEYGSEETFKRLKCTEIVAGDVLISRLPDPVGRACILPPLKTKCITAVDCSILKLKPNEIVPSWFIYYTQSEAYFSSVRAECSGTTRDRITRKKLSIITIPIPSLYEQQRIVDILDKEFEKTPKRSIRRFLYS